MEDNHRQYNLKQFFLFSLVVMILFTVLVRGVLLAPELNAAGPELVSHDLGETYAGRCDICHRREVEWHEDTFGYFDNCMDCHGGAPRTPHPVSGEMSFCLGCHDGSEEPDIRPGHDLMFPRNVSYQECIGCHPPN